MDDSPYLACSIDAHFAGDDHQFGQDTGNKCEFLVILGVVHQKSSYGPADQPCRTFSIKCCCCRVHLC